MAGEHILKALLENNSRLEIGDKWLIAWEDGRMFTVYQCKPYAKKTRTLIETDNEEKACRILKGE